ncbi:MAG: hypothetical protein KME45_04620 [Stenomitos rutilans HA7619-LM2]|jgi:hypothetical protein|nr:hypothetical protein [Stenomitos rutilans HA7619-LM2]
MTVVLCPGVHDRGLTQQFIQGVREASNGLALPSKSLLVFPTERYPAYSGWHVLRFLHERNSHNHPDLRVSPPLVLIGFSAGVVGAMSAALVWQGWRGTVKAVLAIDGWGVPLVGGFPVHRFSHDCFTHWSSAPLGAGEDSFYADPGVAHLELWRSPQTADGWWLTPDAARPPIALSAANFLTALLRRYDEL